MTSVKEIIEKLLEEDPRCREDDKWLTYNVFQIIAKENGQGVFIPFNLFDKFPAFETIKRTRAKIQNEEGRFLPENEVIPEASPHSIPPKEIIVEPNVKLRNSHLI